MRRVLRARSDFANTTLRNQLTSLVLYEAIVTGRLNGKQLASYADHFFNKVKIADLTARKYAHSILLDKNAVRKVFEEILPRYGGSATNYVRSLIAMPRRGDNAKQLTVMLIKEATVTTKNMSPKSAEKPKTATKTAPIKKVK